MSHRLIAAWRNGECKAVNMGAVAGKSAKEPESEYYSVKQGQDKLSPPKIYFSSSSKRPQGRFPLWALPLFSHSSNNGITETSLPHRFSSAAGDALSLTEIDPRQLYLLYSQK